MEFCIFGGHLGGDLEFCTFARATELKKWVFTDIMLHNDMLIYGDTENCNKTLPSLGLSPPL